MKYSNTYIKLILQKNKGYVQNLIQPLKFPCLLDFDQTAQIFSAKKNPDI